MPRYSNNKRLFVLLVSLILLTVIVTFSIKRNDITLPEKVMIDAFSWVQNVVYRPVSHLAGFIDEVQGILELYEENATLKANLRDYQTLSARLAELEHRNQQLETMLNFRQQPLTFKVHPANVTGRNPGEWNSTLTIDKGEAHGVKKEMVVIAPDGGLVGRVMSVNKFSSKVLLITDTNKMGISAVVQDTQSRAVGIVSGSSSQLGAVEMGLIDREANLQVGQKVVTSHLSDIAPPGILIGEITSFTMEESGLTKKATIKPAAKLDRLETVFIVERDQPVPQGQ
ncbi:rod shape-determining protein MreC [Effusibacillus lacus]|uniref:Cell shape-determining protein MreC n=1 Tax=Effusibacillus lacus TaxID=1348429 RepID=A0A292YHP7_9BACL|nr:rod shape-determining protein MreC [Effusibacillus lacus]TCS76498.1 rod shape-determining protein MreC [Effusibacillus lacus]GAX90477.1 rod shape-determining protein MreC [Effusibacillus lacus]